MSNELKHAIEGRLAKRSYQAGDTLPAVGSLCLVSGPHCDIESDQHRSYRWRTVVGYSACDGFMCLQTADCWPTVERTEFQWFAEIPTPRAALAAHPEQADAAEAEYRRGWGDALAAHKLPYGAEVREDHDWRPREVQERNGQVTLPLAEYQRLVADAQTASQEQAEGAGAVAWAVYWGVDVLRPKSVHFERKTAEEVASEIKSNTEIRPLYAHPPTDTSAARPELVEKVPCDRCDTPMACRDYGKCCGLHTKGEGA